MAWVILLAAIASETSATLALRGMADGPRVRDVLIVVVGYGLSFWLLSVALRSLNVGVVYAIWSGVGTAAVAGAAALLYGERLNLTAVGGIVLIVTGVAVLAGSGATGHG